MSRQETGLRITVVIPAYNAAHCIGRAIRSVQEQTEQSFEIIVVDDCSTDDTVAVVGDLAKGDPRIRLLQSLANGGPSIARNKGMLVATGRWIAILDADDAYKPERLSTLCDLAERNDLDAIGDDLLLFDEVAGKEVGPANFVPFSGFQTISFDDFLETTTYNVGMREALFQETKVMSVLKLIFKRDLIEKFHLQYSEKYRYCEDFMFYFDMFRAGARVGFLDAPLYIYTEQLGSISGHVSPHSKTVANRHYIVDAVDDILIDPRGLSDNQIKLLQLRKTSVLSLISYENARKTLKDGQRLGFLRALASRPRTVFLFAREVRKAISGKVYKKIRG